MRSPLFVNKTAAEIPQLKVSLDLYRTMPESQYCVNGLQICNTFPGLQKMHHDIFRRNCLKCIFKLVQTASYKDDGY